jgi:hypothetical protein
MINDAEGRTEREVLAKLDDVISAELRASSSPQ